MMMFRVIFLLWVFCLFVTFLSAQNQTTIDSLQKVLKSNISDKEKVDTYVEIAAEYSDSDSLKTHQYATQAIQLAEKISYPEGKIDALHEIGRWNQSLGNDKEAETIFRQIIQEAEKYQYTKGKAKGLNELGVTYEIQGKYNQALTHYLKALEIYQELNDKKGTAIVYNNLGVSHEVQGKYDEALAYYFKALKIVQELNDKKAIANIYSNIGVIHDYQGHYDKVLEYNFKALKVREEIGDKSGIATTFNNIGIVYNKQGKYDETLAYYSKALEINKEIKDKRGMAYNYSNMGTIYGKQGNYEKALEYGFKALNLFKEIGNKRGIALSSDYIGDVYLTQKNYEKALHYVLKSLAIYDKIGATGDKTYSLLSLGKIYYEQKEWQLSKKYLKECLSLSQEIGFMENIMLAAEKLALVEKKLGNYQAAYEAQVIFKQMADSLQNEELVKRITRLEDEYEFQQEKDSLQFANQAERIVLEKDIENRKNLQNITFIALSVLLGFILVLFWAFRSKSRTNKLLLIKTTELENANEEVSSQKEKIIIQNNQLQELNGVKDRVFSIISHDLRTPISNLQGLLMLFNEEYGLTPAEVQQHIVKLSTHVEGVSGLLSNLLYWARTQMKGSLQLSPTATNITLIIQEVIQLFSETAKIKNIQTIVEVASDVPKVCVDPEILRFLIRNLLNNAYKFSEENGEVIIQSTTIENNQVKLSIQDKGVGIDETTKNQLFKDFVKSKRGTHAETGTGLGLMLCQEFVELSKGKIGVESELGKGSTFWFTLPQAKSLKKTKEKRRVTI